MFYGILAALAAVIVGLDQWTKWLTVTHIPSTNGSAVVKAIPGFFHITHIKNTGAAWSMLEGQTWLFVLVTVAFFAIVGVLIWKKVLQKKFELVCLAMIAGGALGNLIDRVWFSTDPVPPATGSGILRVTKTLLKTDGTALTDAARTRIGTHGIAAESQIPVRAVDLFAFLDVLVHGVSVE